MASQERKSGRCPKQYSGQMMEGQDAYKGGLCASAYNYVPVAIRLMQVSLLVCLMLCFADMSERAHKCPRRDQQLS